MMWPGPPLTPKREKKERSARCHTLIISVMAGHSGCNGVKEENEEKVPSEMVKRNEFANSITCEVSRDCFNTNPKRKRGLSISILTRSVSEGFQY
jgi:hypothetical protein